jgi:acyl carrier protein
MEIVELEHVQDGLPAFDLADLHAAMTRLLGDDIPLPPASATWTTSGVDRSELALLILYLEGELGIGFPSDLIEAIETVDDLLYYVTTKQGHRS